MRGYILCFQVLRIDIYLKCWAWKYLQIIWLSAWARKCLMFSFKDISCSQNLISFLRSHPHFSNGWKPHLAFYLHLFLFFLDYITISFMPQSLSSISLCFWEEDIFFYPGSSTICQPLNSLCSTAVVRGVKYKTSAFANGDGWFFPILSLVTNDSSKKCFSEIFYCPFFCYCLSFHAFQLLYLEVHSWIFNPIVSNSWYVYPVPPGLTDFFFPKYVWFRCLTKLCPITCHSVITHNDKLSFNNMIIDPCCGPHVILTHKLWHQPVNKCTEHLFQPLLCHALKFSNFLGRGASYGMKLTSALMRHVCHILH